MLSRDDILHAFDRISVWTRGSQRAPHKPLLILLALGALARGAPNAFPFRQVDPKLTELLKEFGPPRASYHPEYPFWRLQNDGIWRVGGRDRFQRRKGQTDVPRRQLIDGDAVGHFTDDVASHLMGDPSLLATVAMRLLESHFPASLHQDILDAVGLELRSFETVHRRRRDPEFRGRILRAYEQACAVCGFDVRLGNQTLGLEAAHIQWHQAGGPDVEPNGLALCVLHHKAFDLGAFTVTPERLVVVSELVHGRHGFQETLLKFHGRPLRRPLRESYAPATTYLEWHERQVFRQPPRELTTSA